MIALLIVVSLMGLAVVSWWRLWWGTAAIVLIMPTYLLRFELFTIPTTLLEMGIYVVFAIWLIRLVQRKIDLKLVPKFWWIIIALWLVIGFSSAIVADDKAAGLGLWKAYFLDAALYFVVLVTVIKSLHQVWRVLWLLGSAVLLISLVAIWQALGLKESPEPWISQVPARVSSIFEYPNAVGLFVAPIVGLFLSLVIKRKNQSSTKKNLFAAGTVVFGILATVLAVSQGAWLGILAALIFVSLFSRWRKFIFISLALLMIILLIIPGTRSNVVETVTFRDTSGDVRLRLWQGTIDLLRDHPIIGAGLSGFPWLYDSYRDAAHTELLLYPHNVVLNFWVTTGLAGLAAFIVIVAKFFQLIFFKLKQGLESMVSLRLGLAAAMIALLIHGLVDVPYFKNDLAILFWLIVGLSIILKRLLEIQILDDTKTPK
ncbi:O-antigen ligase family protein [Patescibacteria group bacterium]